MSGYICKLDEKSKEDTCGTTTATELRLRATYTKRRD